MRVPLTIKSDYFPQWGLREGIRELLSNGRDAEKEHGAEFTVEHRDGKLLLENHGVTLPHQALLLGHTTKTGRVDTIGRFGEGLKGGVLALVRAGHSVKIRSGSEVWVPSIQWSDVFKADVLTFDITGGRQEKDRVRIEVGGVSPDAWKQMREGFLFLDNEDKTGRIKTSYGTLLLGEKHQGKVYVKGIFVQSVPDLQFGYDLTEAELDRDRKMIESWNLQYTTRNVYMSALSSNSELFAQFDEMLEQQSPEVQGIDMNNVSYAVSQSVVDHVAQRFIDTHGATAVPVSNLAEAQEVEHLGVRGVIVNRQQAAILQRKMGDLPTIKARLSQESKSEFSWADLTGREQDNLTDAIEQLGAVANVALSRVHIVEFRAEHMLGQYRDGEISIARKVLADPDETLRVLVHEAAHEEGTDGTKSHIQRVEELWMQIVRNLRRVSRYDRT